MVKDVTINCPRSGFTSNVYALPNTDNSAAGEYTCMVAVSTVESAESTGYSITATGILIFKADGLTNKQLELLLLSVKSHTKAVK